MYVSSLITPRNSFKFQYFKTYECNHSLRPRIIKNRLFETCFPAHQQIIYLSSCSTKKAPSAKQNKAFTCVIYDIRSFKKPFVTRCNDCLFSNKCNKNANLVNSFTQGMRDCWHNYNHGQISTHFYFIFLLSYKQYRNHFDHYNGKYYTKYTPSSVSNHSIAVRHYDEKCSTE